MIGNDVIDLNLAKTESNWQRKGFLNKIFTKNEQILIQNSKNKELTVWNIWSRKEAAYKIWNRETGIRKLNPTQFECFDLDLEIGKVQIESKTYYTKTIINSDYIHSVAVTILSDFNKIRTIENEIVIDKHLRLTFQIIEKGIIKPISKSHHGRFEFTLSL